MVDLIYEFLFEFIVEKVFVSLYRLITWVFKCILKPFMKASHETSQISGDDALVGNMGTHLEHRH